VAQVTIKNPVIAKRSADSLTELVCSP
jgi:hypothetical protein